MRLCDPDCFLTMQMAPRSWPRLARRRCGKGAASPAQSAVGGKVMLEHAHRLCERAVCIESGKGGASPVTVCALNTYQHEHTRLTRAGICPPAHDVLAYSLLAIHYLPLTAYHLLPTTHYLQLTTYHLLLLLLFTHHLLLTAHSAYHLLLTTHCSPRSRPPSYPTARRWCCGSPRPAAPRRSPRTWCKRRTRA